MITGIVTATFEAVVSLEVRGLAGHSATIHAVIDTGFSGCLLLSLKTIELLELPIASSGKALLADGQIVAFDVYDGTVIWNDAPRRIEVIATEGEPLIGMELLRGFRIRLDVIENGEVFIERLQTTFPTRATGN